MTDVGLIAEFVAIGLSFHGLWRWGESQFWRVMFGSQLVVFGFFAGALLALRWSST